MMVNIILKIVGWIVGRVARLFAMREIDDANAKVSAANDRAASVETSLKTEATIKDVQHAISDKAEKEKAERDALRAKKQIEKDVLGSLVVTLAVLLFSTGCVGGRFVHTHDRKVEIAEPAKPVFDKIDIDWSKWNDEQAAVLKQILDNFSRLKTYAQQQAVSIKIYNLHAKTDNLATAQALGVKPTDAQLESLKKLRDEVESLTKESVK